MLPRPFTHSPVHPPVFHYGTWVVWVFSAGVLAMTNRNPLYSVILLLVGQLVGELCGVVEAGWRPPVIRLGAVILSFSILFNALLVHVGQTILFSLPISWPLIGGAVTLESAVYGANNGLMLLTLLVIFNAFNRLMPTADLVRLTPRALRDVGVVILIGLTYVPETLQQLRRIQEAQAIRGHRLKGLRDWQPVVVPLLVSGLERAMGLAEAMVARGYGQTADLRQPLMVQLGLVAGLAAAFGGWTLAFWWKWPGWLLMFIGLSLIVVLFWQLGRHARYTRYRPQVWARRDTWVAGTAVLPLLVAFLPLPFVDRATQVYSPYPLITLPPFDAWVGLSLVLLVVPAFFNRTQMNADENG